MAKIRTFFILILISSVFLILSCVKLFNGIATGLYKYDDVNDYKKAYYYDQASEIANDCAYMLHGVSFFVATADMSEKYSDSEYGIFINNYSHTFKTPNYDGTNEIYEQTFYYNTAYNHLVLEGGRPVLISVSITPEAVHNYTTVWNNRYYYVTSTVIIGCIFICSVVLLILSSRNEHTLKSPQWINKMPFTIYVLFGIAITAVSIIVVYIVHKISYKQSNIESFPLFLLIPAISLAFVFTSFITGIVQRCIDKRVFNELIVYKIGKSHGIIAQGILICIYCAVIFIAGAVLSVYVWDFVWIISLLIISGLWILHIIGLHRLDSAINEYCEGDWSVSTTHDPLLLGNMNNNLYKLSASMKATVEKSVRDERTKTELITNVSHDIKTPLTSIINYTDLLKSEDLSEESRKEYLEVLSKNSARMKKLIEDLIEASKVATGNIELHPAVCSIDTLLSQAVAEHEPDAVLRNLKFVLVKNHDPMFITIDGEKLYRVFDNLLSNANKYSLPGSRIYIELSTDIEAHIRFKNITEEQITISPEELTERFVKGDMSRHSEGSGLGLAICKNLVELMGGRLEINIDGDQFMVELSFSLQS